MNEIMKNLSTTINKALSDTVETVIKHCSGEEFSSVSQLVHYILTHPEYELNSIHTTPPDSTTIYKVSYKGEEMASCIISYYFDLSNPDKVDFNVETVYSYDEKENDWR